MRTAVDSPAREALEKQKVYLLESVKRYRKYWGIKTAERWKYYGQGENLG